MHTRVSRSVVERMGGGGGGGGGIPRDDEEDDGTDDEEEEDDDGVCGTKDGGITGCEGNDTVPHVPPC